MGQFSRKSPEDKNQKVVDNSIEKPKSPRELIAEKYRKINERSQFIKEEIERAKQFKQEIEAKYFNK